METRDMAAVVETFRRKFMEGVAGMANRVEDNRTGLVANPGSMAPNGMELELPELVGEYLDGLYAAVGTTLPMPDD